MIPDRLAAQLRFILEIDKLKSVFRQTLLVDRSRLENDAEHSWHLAVMAVLLAEYARDKGLDLLRVVKMALVHDLVEIDAGDTYIYDEAGLRDKAERERAAADRVFGLLPPDQAAEIRGLWEEFEARATPEAQFAAALDRLQPLLHNYHTQGARRRRQGVARANSFARVFRPIRRHPQTSLRVPPTDGRRGARAVGIRRTSHPRRRRQGLPGAARTMTGQMVWGGTKR